jgi:hypothetical protein
LKQSASPNYATVYPQLLAAEYLPQLRYCIPPATCSRVSHPTTLLHTPSYLQQSHPTTLLHIPNYLQQSASPNYAIIYPQLLAAISPNYAIAYPQLLATECLTQLRYCIPPATCYRVPHPTTLLYTPSYLQQSISPNYAIAYPQLLIHTKLAEKTK